MSLCVILGATDTTTIKYKSGDYGEDGRRFWSYCNGREIWRTPESWQKGYEQKVTGAKKRQDLWRARLDKYKQEKGCCVCGYNENPFGLEFDHRPGEKKLFSVGCCGSRSDEVMLAEIAKCDIVCGTCHNIRTISRRYGVACP